MCSVNERPARLSLQLTLLTISSSQVSRFHSFLAIGPCLRLSVQIGHRVSGGLCGSRYYFPILYSVQRQKTTVSCLLQPRKKVCKWSLYNLWPPFDHKIPPEIQFQAFVLSAGRRGLRQAAPGSHREKPAQAAQWRADAVRAVTVTAGHARCCVGRRWPRPQGRCALRRTYRERPKNVQRACSWRLTLTRVNRRKVAKAVAISHACRIMDRVGGLPVHLPTISSETIMQGMCLRHGARFRRESERFGG